MINLKAELKVRPLYGPFQRIPSPDVVEILARSGWDFIVVDGEHGPMIGPTLSNQVRAAEASSIPAIMRVDGPESSLITMATDAGAKGISVPLIETAKAAHKAVSSVRTHPIGSRGSCPFARAAGFGAIPWSEFKRTIDEDLLLVLQVEGPKAVENIEEIVSVEGIDVIVVGRFDLALSLGLDGKMDHPKVWKIAERISSLCTKRSLIAGLNVYDAQESRRAIDMGVRFLLYHNDGNLFYRASKETREKLPSI